MVARARQFGIALLVNALFCVATSHGNDFTVLIFLTRSDVGAAPYSINFDASDNTWPNPSAPIAGILTAPDGTIFDPLNKSLSGLTLEQVVSRFTGKWTYEDVDVLPVGSPSQFHEFTIGPDAIGGKFQPFPTILSPAFGAEVPPVFDVFKQPMDPALPGYLDISVESDVKFFDNNHARFTVPMAPGELNKDVTLLAGHIAGVTIGLATPTTPNPANRVAVSLQLYSETSRPLRIVIPEPATIALGGFVLLSLTALRRRK